VLLPDFEPEEVNASAEGFISPRVERSCLGENTRRGSAPRDHIDFPAAYVEESNLKRVTTMLSWD